MEFNIVAVTKLTVGIGAVWLIAMGVVYMCLKRERAAKKRTKPLVLDNRNNHYSQISDSSGSFHAASQPLPRGRPVLGGNRENVPWINGRISGKSSRGPRRRARDQGFRKPAESEGMT